jgi:hypothetical protein
MDVGPHLVQLIPEREMAGIQKVQLSLRQIPQVGCRAIRWENLVVLAPENECRRLRFAEECLELRIQRHAAAAVVEQVELDVPVARAVQQHLVVQPIVRVDARDIAGPVDILKRSGLRRDKEVKRVAPGRGVSAQ